MTNIEAVHDLTLNLYHAKRETGLKVSVAEITFPENQERYIIYRSMDKKEYVTVDTNIGDKG